MISMARIGILAASALALAAWPHAAEARPNRFALEPPHVESTAAYRYAELSSADCLAALRAREVPFERVVAPRAVAGMPRPFHPRGVDTPLRLTGPLWGVTFRPAYRAQPDDQAPETVADCRLALALDDLASVLRQYGVVEAHYMSMYRRGWARPGHRHPAGRAVDLTSVKFADGSTYSVREDFHGRIGAETCGEKATKPTRDTPGARFWRRVICDLEARRAFNLILSPHYDWGHRDHLHLEVRSGIRWYLVQ